MSSAQNSAFSAPPRFDECLWFAWILVRPETRNIEVNAGGSVIFLFNFNVQCLAFDVGCSMHFLFLRRGLDAEEANSG